MTEGNIWRQVKYFNMLFSGALECFYHKFRSEFYIFLIHCLTYTYKYKKTLGHLISRPRYFRQAKKKTPKNKTKAVYSFRVCRKHKQYSTTLIQFFNFSFLAENPGFYQQRNGIQARKFWLLFW